MLGDWTVAETLGSRATSGARLETKSGSSDLELPVPCSVGSGIAGAPTPTRSRGCSVEWNLIGLESDYREGCRSAE